MANKLVRLVTKQYVPAVRAVPPSPPRCYTRTTGGQRLGSVGGAGTLSSSAPSSGSGLGTRHNGFMQPIYRQVPAYVDEDGNVITQELVGYTPVRFSPNPEVQPQYSSNTVTVCTPGAPGVQGSPAQVVTQGEGPDWRASARSIQVSSGDVTASFNVNDRPRAIVGFATRDTGPNQNDIRMGVAFISTGATSQVAPILDGVAQPVVAPFTSGARVSLSRVGSRFFIALDGTLVYATDATTSDPVTLDAMLYTSSDAVYDPEFSTPTVTAVYGSVGFSMGLIGEPLVLSVGFSGVVKTGVVSVDGSPVPGGIDNSDLNSAGIVIGPLYFSGSDKAYTAGQVVLSSLVTDASGGELSQAVAGAEVVLASVQAYGTMLSGGNIDAALELQPLAVLGADRSYAEGRFVLPALATYGDDGFGIPNYYGHNDSLRLTAPIYTDPSLFASMYETLELETEVSFATLLSGSVMEALILDPSVTVADFLAALIESGINLSSATQMPDPTSAQYAFNALTGAATRYSDFGFTQFVRAGGTTYAVKPDGLYRLRPGDDAGERRSALVDFGAMSFGVTQRKNIETMYLGVSTDGTVYAKLKADDGEDKTYRVIQREPTMRVRTGKGITAREWTLKLEVIDASHAELGRVDFVVGASVRRWTR